MAETLVSSESAYGIKQRILSIQSHVVSGYVGNKAAVFPLQLLGFDVDVVNSVHFSNHTGYENGFEGDILKGEQLRSILNGLSRNDLLSDTGHILTGYIGSESFLEAIVDVVKMVRDEVGSKSKRRLRFVCDPVLGDNGKFYVPVELVRLYREKVIPLSDVLTPNQFEVEQLTGTIIRSIDDAKRACRELHKMGPSLVIVTSMDLDSKRNLTIVASQLQQASTHKSSETQLAWRIDCPILSGHFTGTGDLCAALFLAHTSNFCNSSENNVHEIPHAMERVINTMYAILDRTSHAIGSTTKSRELKIVQSQDLILNPPERFKAESI